MKKFAVIALALAMVAIPSCKNQNKKAAESSAKKEISQKEQYATEDLKINIENLIASAKQMKPVPFASKEEGGKITLTTKEKMVKPDYLLEFSAANDLVTLSQKYRAIAMYAVDEMIAKLYEMPTSEYTSTEAKLLLDINDSALKAFADADKSTNEATQAAIAALVDAEYDANRANFLWETVAASLVEQIYILTQNIDKFLPMFDDQTASDITFNFICVHEGIMSMMEFYPELESLNSAMLPLYVINAINVEQLKNQLTELKGEIEAVRYILLK